MSDLISRQDAIDALMDFDKKLRKINWYQYPHTEYECRGVDEAIVKIENVPPAQPEPCEDAVSREAAIDVAENAFVRGLLASPDIRKLPSVQPVPCEDAVSRDSVKFLLCKETCHPGAFCPDGFCREICEKVDALPSATPKQRMGEWIPVSERLPGENEFVLVTFGWFGRKTDPGVNIDEIRDGDWMFSEVVTAWMPLPEPYRAERRTDEPDK